jgi:peptidoglycan hydrolase FlgJ
MKIDKSKPPITNPANEQLKSKLRNAAELYEKQFLREMVKAMRNSVSHSAMTQPGMAENIYREQLDDKYVDSWVERGGTGFADMVYQEIVDKYFPHLESRGPKAPVRQIRPVSVSDRFQGVVAKPQGGQPTEKKTSDWQIQLGPNSGDKPSYLNVPWQSKFEKAFQLESGDQVAQLSHPSGLTSTFVFKGRLNPNLLGQTLAQGESFAQLSPETQILSWKISDADSQKGPSEKENKSFR